MRIHYRETEEGIEIVRCFGTDGNIELPEEIKGRPVTRAAAYAFSARKAQEDEEVLVCEKMCIRDRNLVEDDWMDFPFERDFWGKKNPLYGKNAKNMMKTDIREHDNGYEVDIDLPGFKKDEINLELENGYLTVSAAKGLDKDEKDDKGKYIRRERYAGAMQRSFYVGDTLTQEDIKAKYENGILKMCIRDSCMPA